VVQHQIIIADDLTGAADAAAAWAHVAPIAVLFGHEALAGGIESALAIDTDSRHVTAAQASQRVAQAMAAAAQRNARIYKKIDSTLRGNTATEIISALTAYRETQVPQASALLAPAFPATGRTVRGGILHLHGQPLPNGRGDIAALLHGYGVRTGHLGLTAVRAGSHAFASAYQALTGDLDIIVVDAETMEDLALIHRGTDRLGSHVLPIGSAGLIASIAADEPRQSTQQTRAVPRRAAKPVLTVLGSYNDIAQQQRIALVECGTRSVTLRPPFDHHECETIATLHAQLAAGDALLTPDPALPLARRNAPAVAAAMASVGRVFLHGEPRSLAGLIATGGETARTLLQAAGVDRLMVSGEIEPGVVLSQLPQLDNLALITKAGGFGEADTLVRAQRYLHG
jgi:uncharacterized protein YgbK (DUF1537 family)